MYPSPSRPPQTPTATSTCPPIPRVSSMDPYSSLSRARTTTTDPRRLTAFWDQTIPTRPSCCFPEARSPKLFPSKRAKTSLTLTRATNLWITKSTHPPTKMYRRRRTKKSSKTKTRLSNVPSFKFFSK